MRLLVIEDERALAATLKKGLEEEGYAVDVATDGTDGLFLAENEPFDLVLLDIMLPGVDGMTILRKLRDAGRAMPVLMLTARDTVADKVHGLDAGADDYLTKPFAFDELLARIRRLLRQGTPARCSALRVRDLEIDMAAHEVRRAGARVPLTAREYALLEYLALNPNRVFNRAELAEHLYDFNFEGESNLIDVCIHRIRAKLERGEGEPLIQTRRGEGYLLKA